VYAPHTACEIMNHWLLWVVVLFLQNFSFTFVSRARNSASLSRHLLACIMSNGIWFIAMILTFGEIVDILKGKQGIGIAMLCLVVYTAATVSGSISSHYLALITERGKSRVGANKHTHTLSVEDWQFIQLLKAHHNA
jgi:hypothetical protein